MHKYAIITDDAVQGLNGHPLANIDLYTIDFSFPISNKQTYLINLNKISIDNNSTRTSKYQSSSIEKLIKTTNANYDEVFCLTSADCITHIHGFIQEIAKNNHNRANFHLIDSQSLSGGLGFLINKTIQMIKGKNLPSEIDTSLREIIPNIYTLLCSNDLASLYSSKFIDAGQLIIGEQHSIIPLFSLENGQVNSLEKFKNFQGVLEYLVEFLEEYPKSNQLVLIYPQSSQLPIFSEIKQFALQNNEINSIIEFKSNEFLAKLIGPEGFGLILVE